MDLAHHYPELNFQNGTQGFNLIQMRGDALQIVGGIGNTSPGSALAEVS